jgi:prevent-host-death family protein
VSERIYSTTDFRANSGEIFETVRAGATVLVTRHGRPACYLVPPAEYAALLAARATLADLIRRQVGQ